MAEKKERQDNKGEFRTFRELLKKGIGLRTQADFAEACGITRPYLNTLLKKDLISRPTVETLRKMAKAMNGVSCRELLESCGYPVRNTRELADAIAVNITSFFMDNSKSAATPVTHVPILELCDSFYMLYCPAGVDEMKFAVKEEKENTNAKYPDADKETVIEIRWGDQEYDCKTSVHLYYAVIRTGGRVMLGVECEKTETGESAVIRAKGSQFEQQLRKLFGSEDAIFYPTFERGYGFPYKDTPKKFKDFLSNHRKTFCTDEERSRLWRRIVVDGEDPDKACIDYSEVLKNNCTDEDEEEDCDITTGVIVAEIMTKELKDLSCMKDDHFEFYEEDENLPEGERDSFVMTTNNTHGKDRHLLMPYLYFYAHELGISHFGACYYRYMEEVNRAHWNSTEEYGKYFG